MQGPRIEPQAVPTSRRGRQTTRYEGFDIFGSDPRAQVGLERALAYNPLAGPGADFYQRQARQLPGVDENFVSSVLAPTRQRILSQDLPAARARLGSQFAQAGAFFGSPHASAQADLEQRVMQDLGVAEGQLRASQYGASQQAIERANAALLSQANLIPQFALAPLQYLQRRFLPVEQMSEEEGTTAMTPQYAPSPFQQAISLLGALAPIF